MRVNAYLDRNLPPRKSAIYLDLNIRKALRALPLRAFSLGMKQPYHELLFSLNLPLES